MKRIILYIIVLAGTLMVPMDGMDVGKLKPVEVVQLFREGEQLVLRTDTGDIGKGKTVDEAFYNLEETTAGIVFLDTADYLLVSEEVGQDAQMLIKYLKPNTRVCQAQKNIDPLEAAPYLNVHCPTSKLKNLGSIATMQKLVRSGQRLLLQ